MANVVQLPDLVLFLVLLWVFSSANRRLASTTSQSYSINSQSAYSAVKSLSLSGNAARSVLFVSAV